MKIGLTYDLRSDPLYQDLNDYETAEYDGIGTVEAVENALREQGYQTERIGHIQQLVKALAEGKRWDLIFNFAEGRFGRCREAQIPALLDAYQIPYVFSDPLTMALCMDKSLAKTIVKAHGIHTAPFKVIETKEDLAFIDLDFPLFAKPLSEGSSIGIHSQSCIRTEQELQKVSLHLLEQYSQPVLVETYLPKREFTVGIVGTGSRAEVLGVMEIKLRVNEIGYIYGVKKSYKASVDYSLATDSEAERAQEAALKAYRVLGCRDAARIDFRSDAKGIPHFLECNPIAGISLNSDLPRIGSMQKINYSELIGKIVHSACGRNNLF
jgi:D-alanine-D-alanine ligase